MTANTRDSLEYRSKIDLGTSSKLAASPIPTRCRGYPPGTGSGCSNPFPIRAVDAEIADGGIQAQQALQLQRYQYTAGGNPKLPRSCQGHGI